MTVREAARLLGVSISTIYRWIKRGGLKARKVGRRWEVERRVSAKMVARGRPMNERSTGYDPVEADRLHADAVARYEGRCAPDLYPVAVTGIQTSHGGIWVKTSQPHRPLDSSFNFVQEHDVELEYVQDGGFPDKLHKYNGPDQGGVPFIDDCPVALEEPFRCRARARWGMQDAHPENRGFMALPGYDGRTYYGKWSPWSEWLEFPTEEQREQREREEAERAAIEKATREHAAAVKRREAAEAARDAAREHERDTVEACKEHPFYVPTKDDLKEDGQFFLGQPEAVAAARGDPKGQPRCWAQRRWIAAINSWKVQTWLTMDDVEAYLKRRGLA